MSKKNAEARESGCPIAFTLDVIGDKWSLLVIRDMTVFGKKYYGEFLESPEKIATNILAERLKKLEAAEIITKRQDLDNQKKFIYQLTEKGHDLIPIIQQIMLWGAKHDPNTIAKGKNLERLQEGGLNMKELFKEKR
jgi:DNA-binding HxlR family transcriptional regulator